MKELISDVCKCLHEEINKFDAALESWNSSSVCDLSDRLALLNLCADGQNAVFEHINYSHSYAIKDIRAALKNKLKLLGNLIS